jgi:predicted RNase H-like HicB family nuclease
MKRTIQVHISKGDRLFVAECLDLPVVTEAAALDELASNIREAIGLHLEGEDLTALGLAATPTILATMELEAGLMPKLRVLSGREVLTIFREFGFQKFGERQSHQSASRSGGWPV